MAAATPRRLAAPRGDARRTRRGRRSLLYPLDVGYARAGIPTPRARAIDPAAIPPPYRSLLVHEGTMTHLLEHHFGGHVTLRLLSSLSRGQRYYRRVLVVQQYSGRPVELGAVGLDLDAFPARLRAGIRRNEVPLGRLLRDGRVDYQSRPTVFFGVTPSSKMMGAFWMRKPLTLYGRQTEMRLGGKKVGDVVEILPRV